MSPSGAERRPGPPRRPSGRFDREPRSEKLRISSAERRPLPPGNLSPDLAHYRETRSETDAAPAEPDPLLGRAIGPCQVLEFIGQGSSGRVYRALHQRLAFEVALKVILPAAGGRQRALERFQREARVAARLNHPNVVRVYDVDQEKGTHYIIQELVRGESLDARVRRAGKLEEALAIELGRDLASGLASIHKAGVVHRDVKPENVILTAGDAPKLLDFGIAKDVEVDTGTAQDTMLGTPRFMSPEQAGSDRTKIGPAADIYGLGATLFFALTGRAPHEPRSEEPLLSFLNRRLREPPPRLSALRPGTNPGLAALIERLLAPDPDARPGAEEASRAFAALDQGLDTALLKPLAPPTPATDGGGGTQGTFEDLPLVEILQGIEFNEKSGELEVHGEGITGRVTFEGGQPHEASTSDGKRGERAILRLLELSAGSFQLRRDVQVSGPRLIPTSFTRLILDFHRQSDESERLPIPVDPEPTPPPAPPPPEPKARPPSLKDRSSATLRLGRSQTLDAPASDHFDLAISRLEAEACAPLSGDPFLGCSLGPFQVGKLLGLERGEHRYLGTHIDSGKKVLLRVFPLFGAHKEELRALAERAKGALAVHHPNLESCLGAGTSKDAFYAGYRPALGPTLEDELRQRRALTPEEVTRIIGSIGLALSALHGKHLVHGHVGPRTVRLVGEERRPVLCETGLARTAPAHRFLSTKAQVPGHPGFVAPEVLDLGVPTPAGDVYALGCLAQALLRGQLPGDDAQSSLQRCQADSQVGIPSGLGTVIGKLTGRSPKRRYANANEFLTDLAAFERGKQVLPFPAQGGSNEAAGEESELQALLARQRARVRRTLLLVIVLLLVDLGVLAGALRAWRDAQQVELPAPFEGYRFTLEPPR